MLSVRFATALAVSVLLTGPALSSAKPRPVYDGLWAETARQCRDPDGVDRLEINGRRFFWYETRCTVRGGAIPAGRAWTPRLACEGEGRRFSARPRLSLPSPDRLVMEDAPVGPDPKRQVYRRCPGP